MCQGWIDFASSASPESRCLNLLENCRLGVAQSLTDPCRWIFSGGAWGTVEQSGERDSVCKPSISLPHVSKADGQFLSLTPAWGAPSGPCLILCGPSELEKFTQLPIGTQAHPSPMDLFKDQPTQCRGENQLEKLRSPTWDLAARASRRGRDPGRPGHVGSESRHSGRSPSSRFHLLSPCVHGVCH